MRSRYVAFCRGNIDYLSATHHPFRRKADDRQTMARTIAETEWLSLRVLNAVGNMVEYAAFCEQNGRTGQLYERSMFVQEDGRWYYVTGTVLEPLQTGRNDPCWCGSGKKYKKCHGI